MKIRNLFCTVSLLVFFCIAASGQTPSWPQQKSDIPADPHATFGSLPNGVRYIVMENAEPPGRVSMRLVVNVGSLMETEDERGTAHFLEHMAFNGNRHHPGNEIVAYFQRLGMGLGNDTNAYTGFDQTVYLLELPKADGAMLDEAVQVMRDYADGDSLTEKEIEKERGVILSEKHDSNTDAFRRTVDSFKFSMPDSVMANRMPIGDESVISTMTRKKLRTFYKQWYTPDRMVLVVVGDVKSAEVVKLIQSRFGSMHKKHTRPDPDLGTIKPRGVAAHTYLSDGTPDTVTISTIRPITSHSDTVETRRINLNRQIANTILTRRLQLLAKDNDACFTNGGSANYKLQNFLEGTDIDLSRKTGHTHAEALAVAEQQLRAALTYGFTQAEVDETVADIRKNLEQAARSAPTRKSADIINEIVWKLDNNDVFSTPAENLEIADKAFKSLTPDTVLATMRDDWKDGTRLIMAAGQTNDPLTDAKLLAAYTESASKPVKAPQETTKAKFAYSIIGTPGEVVWRNEQKDLGITQLRFANNVHVNLMPASVTKDGVYLRIQFGTGTIEMPKAGLNFLASNDFSNFGLKAHSAEEIKTIFAGRAVGSYFKVEGSYFMFGSMTNPRDLEAQLNLFAAYMIAPGFRKDGLEEVRNQLMQSLKYGAHDPWGVFTISSDRFLSNNDYRLSAPDVESLQKITIDDLRNWLEPQLAHARVEISIYGDFNVDETIPKLARTFGALPTRDAENRDLTLERTVNMRTDGRTIFEYPSENPRTLIVLAWPTDDAWDMNRSHRLALLGSILTDRLRNEIREKLGNAYSPFVVNTPNWAYLHFGYMLCICEVNPEKTDETITTIRSLVENLVQKGVTQDEFDRAQKPFLSMLETAKRNPDYWTAQIMGSCQETPVRLEWARHLMDSAKSIRVEDINATAAKYLTPDRMIEMRIVPVKPLDKPAPATTAAPAANSTSGK